MIRKRLASVALALGLTVGAYLPLGAAGGGEAEAAVRALHVGDRGPQVVLIQQLLGVRQTGFFGNETRGAVVNLQRRYHLPVTGTVTQQTALTMLKIKASRAHRPAPRPAPRRVVPRRPAPRRPAPSIAARAIQVAASQRGKPYVWGATGPRAFDCSGYTQFVYSRLGKRLPRTTWQQYAATKIPPAQLRVGDLIFSWDLTHVGIYAGYGSMWNAPHTGAPVRLQPVWYGWYRVGRVR